MSVIQIEHLDVPVLVRTLKSVVEDLQLVWCSCCFTPDGETLVVPLAVNNFSQVLTVKFDGYNPIVLEIDEWGDGAGLLERIGDRLTVRGVHVSA